MTRNYLFAIPAALALFGAAATAKTDAPASVGVAPQTAEKANEKAIQRNDTGTVVRTAPPATERVAPRPAAAASSAVTPNAAASTAAPARPPRADRG